MRDLLNATLLQSLSDCESNFVAVLPSLTHSVVATLPLSTPLVSSLIRKFMHLKGSKYSHRHALFRAQLHGTQNPVPILVLWKLSRV
jgi:hypothetical protein